MLGSLAKSRAARSVEQPRTAPAQVDAVDGLLARRLTLHLPRTTANLLPTGSNPKVEAPDASRFTEENRGLQLVGATGFEPATTCTPSGELTFPKVESGSQAIVTARNQPYSDVQRSQRIAPLSKDFAANLLPPFPGGVERLLTVRQVAEVLGVCAATVYKWAANGVLPHVRIVNVIRVRGDDLTRFLATRTQLPALLPRSP